MDRSKRMMIRTTGTNSVKSKYTGIIDRARFIQMLFEVAKMRKLPQPTADQCEFLQMMVERRIIKSLSLVNAKANATRAKRIGVQHMLGNDSF